jgi:hypothetical protein
MAKPTTICARDLNTNQSELFVLRKQSQEAQTIVCGLSVFPVTGVDTMSID